jgi:hypothetical protein
MCGQSSGPLRLTFADIVREAMEEFLKFDSKLFHTLVPLLTRPGQLTNEWSRGRRTRYISPFKLYLTATFLFFLVAAYRSSGPAASDVAVRPAAVRGKTDAQIAREALRDYPETYRFLDRQFAKIRGSQTKVEVMIERMPQAMFLLLPLFALALKLLFGRTGRFYVEHFVFALHTHAFAFLVLTLGEIPPGAWGPFLATAASGLYGVVALRRVYGQSWGITLLKGAALAVGYGFLLLVAALLTLLITAAAIPDDTRRIADNGSRLSLVAIRPLPETEARANIGRP